MRRQIVEPLWSRADATDGNDRQRRCRPKSLSYLRSLADDCHQLRPPLYGKEGVDGSSPSVGSAKARIAGRSFRHELARPQLLRYGAVYGAPRAVHHARRGDARHRDARAILLGVLEHTLAVPLGREAECVRVSVLDTRALQVSDVDELRAALIGPPRRSQTPAPRGRRVRRSVIGSEAMPVTGNQPTDGRTRRGPA
jgi:hypothetical protein